MAGTASSALALCLSTSAPCVSAVADVAAAGPMADVDADDSSHIPLVLVLVLLLVLVLVEDLCCEPFFVENVNVHFSKHPFFSDMLIVFSIVDFPPSGLY